MILVVVRKDVWWVIAETDYPGHVWSLIQKKSVGLWGGIQCAVWYVYQTHASESWPRRLNSACSLSISKSFALCPCPMQTSKWYNKNSTKWISLHGSEIIDHMAHFGNSSGFCYWQEFAKPTWWLRHGSTITYCWKSGFNNLSKLELGYGM